MMSAVGKVWTKGSCEEQGLRGEGSWRSFKRPGDTWVGSEGQPYSSLWGYTEPSLFPKFLFFILSQQHGFIRAIEVHNKQISLWLGLTQ